VCVCVCALAGDAQVDESSIQDLLEDKLKALIDGTSQRRFEN